MSRAVPKLRFPEFTGEWDAGHAGEAFTKGTAKGSAELPIYSVTMDRGLVPRDSLDRHMGDDAEDGANLRAEAGDIVYNMMRMWQGAAGVADRTCMVSPAYVILKPKKHTSSDFFNQRFGNARMLYLLWAYSHGLTSDRLRLYFDDFAKIPLATPGLPEQQKIASFLGAVDGKISGLRRKEATLVRFKAGLMQKLFSQKLRFTRDDGSAFPDWDWTALRDLTTLITKGTTPTSVGYQYVSEGVNFIKVENLERLRDGNISSREFMKVSWQCHDALKRSQLVENDLLVSIAGSLGVTAIVDSSILPANINQALAIVRFKDHELRRFADAYLNSPGAQKLIAGLGSTGAQPNLSLGQIADLEIPLPHPDEQRKIADALSAMDTKIAAVRGQISKMESFKKGLLQQMFV